MGYSHSIATPTVLGVSAYSSQNEVFQVARLDVDMFRVRSIDYITE